ncbi:MAG: insulinase family protein, partial [Opitutae bacterium]|nr:insulinase family protein [Opitutae bacterium]
MGDLYSDLIPLLEHPNHRRLLDNGMTVLVREDASSAISSVQLWVKTGSIHEGAFLGAGLSHYLEHMLFKGTGRRKGKTISREVQSLGGHINAYTTFDRTVYYIDLPSEHTRQAMDILSDAGFKAKLPADQAEKEREVILREIDMGMDDPDRRLGRALFESAFIRHPYRYPVIGYREVFETVDREDLLGYYQSRYVPNNMALVVVGDVEVERVVEWAEELFGGVNRKPLAEIYIPDEPAMLAARRQTVTGDVNLTRIGLALRIPGIHAPDAPALDLLAAILGAGESSILWERLREDEKLVYQVGASSWNPGSAGLLLVSMVTDEAKAEGAVEAFWQIVEELKGEGIPQERLAKARRQAIVAEVNSRKTMNGQASHMGAAEVVIGDLEYPRQYLERIRSVTNRKLLETINAYLLPSGCAQAMLKPKSNVPRTKGTGKVRTSLPQFKEVTLDNGPRLLFQKTAAFPKVHIRVIFRGGPLWEDPGKRGITTLFSTMMTKDTKKRTSR